MTADMHVKFDTSETVWRRIEVPLGNGGRLLFDLPEGVGRNVFNELLEQARTELEEEYRRTHKLPDWHAFACSVQARIDKLAEAKT